MRLSTICQACQRHRKYRTLLYHPETLDAYCYNPFDCSDDHPNNLYRATQRGSVIQMVTHEEASKLFLERMAKKKAEGDTDFVSSFLHQHAGKSHCTRLSNENLIRLARYMQDKDIDTIYNALQQCVLDALDSYENHLKPAEPEPGPVVEEAETEQPEEEVEEIIEVVEPEDEWEF